MTTSIYPGATRAERERERMRLKHAKEKAARAAAGPKTTACKDCACVIVITGTGRPPTRCPSCRVKAEAASNRKRNERQKQRERVKAGETVTTEDDDTPTVDPINIELGRKLVELLFDPLPVEDGGFRPGARFDTDAIVTCGRNFGGATVQPWVYPGMIFQVHPYGKEPTKYRVNQDYRTERIA